MKSKLSEWITLILLLGGCNWLLAQPSSNDSPENVTMFHPTMDEVTKSVGWRPLREHHPVDGTFEVRIWTIPAHRIAQAPCIALKFAQQKWMVSEIATQVETGNYVANVLVPTTSWPAIWTDLEKLGILRLPDESKTENQSAVLDGCRCIVEISLPSGYRAYSYSNTNHGWSPESRQLALILKRLHDAIKRQPPG